MELIPVFWYGSAAPGNGRKPHGDFHQFYVFGRNPFYMLVCAEIEVGWVKKEKHTITSPTVLHYPPGLVHNPLKYIKVNKPVFHLDIFFAPEYVKIPFVR
jgi:hypothetical protein